MSRTEKTYYTVMVGISVAVMARDPVWWLDLGSLFVLIHCAWELAAPTPSQEQTDG